MDEILSGELDKTELPHAEAEEVGDEEFGIPDISEADFVPQESTVPFTYEECEEEEKPPAVEKTENGAEDLTEFVFGSFDIMKDEQDLERDRPLVEGLLFNSRTKRYNLDYVVKNAGNILGIPFGLAVASVLQAGVWIYFLLAVSFSFLLGFLKHYFIDKQPLKQSLRTNLSFTLSVMVVLSFAIAIISKL